jgi:hypothetical protein
VTERKPFDWSDYNAKLSMQNAMDTAAANMAEVPTGRDIKINVLQLEASLHIVDTWVRIAQVHATNMQTETIARLKY